MKTLTYVEGDLLKYKSVEVIGHQANCQNTFGSGIARSIREMYPEAYQADTKADELGRNLLGNFSVADIPLNGRVNRYNNHIKQIFNLYGQNLGTNHARYDRKTNYEALYCALEGMVEKLKTQEEPNSMDYGTQSKPVPSVGFPYLMGSALGGGNFDIVSRLIEVAFDGYQGDVFIVKFKP